MTNKKNWNIDKGDYKSPEDNIEENESKHIKFKKIYIIGFIFSILILLYFVLNFVAKI